MKSIRLLFLSGVLAAAACSSPTEPRMPQPNPDEDEEPPVQGLIEPAAPLLSVYLA
ncbi:MAG TPA: hypothetical protein VFU06_16835 [Longimicrobiales bacterium]|nr:hypothetical protein [Longimicrobiales bacterium]